MARNEYTYEEMIRKQRSAQRFYFLNKCQVFVTLHETFNRRLNNLKLSHANVFKKELVRKIVFFAVKIF